MGCAPVHMGPGSFDVRDTVVVSEPGKKSAIFLAPTGDKIDVNRMTVKLIERRRKAEKAEQLKKQKKVRKGHKCCKGGER